ncbi:transketolase [Actinacidiphila acidipaludis]|uniref:Transketolase n=1 Tax=Actinacidiphila acidipaludis TaxID=2873382 RepID=A0ABS7Q496_9ACTN|nr:transketolase [Streptomyces acidipaludis]MBY8877970.1 transketolase [Streptomyces acidipaludis]
MNSTATQDRVLNDAEIAELAQQLRVDAVRAAAAAGSGHPTSSMSAAELIAVLLARHLHYDFDDPKNPGNDHLILSKGHASPLLYAAYVAAGAVTEEELLTTYRKFGSRLEGHPTPKLPWVDVATGSLGQGLPIGAGVALSAKRLDDLPFRTWVLCGDSELAEGSIWEAFEMAGVEGLDNLTAILDINRLGQRGPTRHGWDLDAYARRIEAFGWHVEEIDGHDVAAVDEAMKTARRTRGKPTAIIARTRKGRGVAAVEDQEGFHGKPLPDADAAVSELGGVRHLRVHVQPPEQTPRRQFGGDPTAQLPRYDLGDQVATRNAFGDALTVLGTRREDVVVLDGEVGDSTKAQEFAKEHPERYIECFIAEQQLIATAVGTGVCERLPYASTFAAFLTRAHDFLRMAAISRSDIKVVGSHAGVAIGEDGPSQMALEDLAMMRTLHGSTVLYPCDANQTARLVTALAGSPGIGYLRTTRGATPVIYGPDEEFPVGGCKVLRSSPEDQVTLIGAGVTLHEALAAADQLVADGTRARVIDLYSVKPVDAQELRAAAETTGRFVVVEDHHPEGGLADAVLESFCNGHPMPLLTRLAVHTMPGSATPDQQLHAAGINADAIAAAARKLVNTPLTTVSSR